MIQDKKYRYIIAGKGWGVIRKYGDREEEGVYRIDIRIILTAIMSVSALCVGLIFCYTASRRDVWGTDR